MWIFIFSLVFAEPFRVIIDPGHGGSDHGAVSKDLKESEIVLRVAKELNKLLESDQRFLPTLTRKEDRNLTLQERVDIANRNKGQLFLSLHVNSAPDERAQGVEFFFQNHLPADEDSLFLAKQENEAQQSFTPDTDTLSKSSDVFSILEDLGRQHRIRSSHSLSLNLIDAWAGPRKPSSLRQAPFFVVSKPPMPSVLVELGFLTHLREAEKLNSHTYQKEMAVKLHRGLTAYLKFWTEGANPVYSAGHAK